MQESAVGRPNRELVVYGLYLLGGATRRIHTEDVAVKCHELFPDSFSWTKYTQYPDKDIVRVALTDARKSQYGAMVDGRAGQKRQGSGRAFGASAEDGWMLTEAGLQWVLEHQSSLSGYPADHAAKDHRQKLLKELARVRKHELFQRFTEDPDRFSAMIGDVADLLRCRVDADQEVWSVRFNTIRRQAEAAEQRDVVDFIAKCRGAVEQQL
jgi:hypothetical protein